MLFAHAGPLFGYTIANSHLAVVIFFIISGFYMALVLDTKYTGKRARAFLGNRFLRIYPLYLTALFAMIVLASIKFFFHVGSPDNAILHYLTRAPHQSPIQFAAGLANYILRNATLIGTWDYITPIDTGVGYLLVQQAWTLQIELLFYLAAPVLISLRPRIFLAAATVYMFVYFGIAKSFRLPPTLTVMVLDHFYFFLLGIIVYRYLYKRFKDINSWIPQASFLFLIGYLLLYRFVSFPVDLPRLTTNDIVFVLAAAALIPFIFIYTKNNTLDRRIGELSYPVYIFHFIIIKALSNIGRFHGQSPVKTIVAIAATVAVSSAAVWLIDRPLDAYRQRRIRYNKAHGT